MSSKLKKILSVLIVALVIFGIYVSMFGIGSIENLKKSLEPPLGFFESKPFELEGRWMKNVVRK